VVGIDANIVGAALNILPPGGVEGPHWRAFEAVR